MLKGLLIRQGFRALDLVLVGLMACVAFVAVRQALWTPADHESQDGGFRDDAGQGLNLDSQVGSREQYEVIVANRLFGEAANRMAPKEVVEPKEPGPTKAPDELRLWGTTTGYPTDPLGSAVIENAAAMTVQKIDAYLIGDRVTDHHVLIEIWPRKAILRNTVTNGREVLDLEDGTGPVTVAAAPSTRGMRRPTPRANYAKVSRTFAMEEFTTRGTELIQEVKPRMHKDEDGNIVGITSDNLSEIPLAQQAGLKDGDIVQAVNGVKIDNEDSIGEIFRKFQNSTTIRLSVLRNGKTQMLNINVTE